MKWSHRLKKARSILTAGFLLGAGRTASAQIIQYTPGAYGSWPSSTQISASTTSCRPTGNGRGLIDNKGVVGILLSALWRDIETADAVLDWSQVEARLRESQACGLAVALSLGISLGNTPPWLTASSSGGGTSDYGVQLANLPGSGTVPVFWDPILTSYRVRFINAGANFLASLPPAVSGSVVAVLAQPFGANTNDWFVPHTPAQIRAWLAAGYRDPSDPDGQPSSRMVNTAMAILDATAAAFPAQNVKLPFQVTAEELDGTKTALAKAVLNYAYTHYAGRFYAQLNILKGISPLSCASPCFLDDAGENNNPLSLFKLLRDHQYADGTVGIQDAAAVVNGAVDDCRQNGQHPCHPCDTPPVQYADVLQLTLNPGLSYAPAFFEFWNGDARAQTGSGNPCPISDPGRASLRQAFTNATINMGGTPRP